MHILYLNPYHGGSHAQVATGFARHSAHQVELLTMPISGGWRWRMRGAAVTMARLVAERRGPRPDLLLTTDMLDLATFRGLAWRAVAGIPAAIYMHENQLTYPLPPGRERDLSYAWTNYTALLAADLVIFNSAFHQRELLAALPELLRRYFDYHELEAAHTVAERSIVLPPGSDLRRLDAGQATGERARAGPPVLLWNARWEYDKNPAAFFAALRTLAARGVDFRLIVAGEHVDPQEPSFAAARAEFAAQILHWGYAADSRAYARLLWQADVVVSTAIQEFFGLGIIEALWCGCVPVVPRRLAYPELLPPEWHAQCLYAHDAGLADHLQGVFAELPRLRACDWRSIAAPYDWRVLAPRYDAALAGV